MKTFLLLSVRYNRKPLKSYAERVDIREINLELANYALKRYEHECTLNSTLKGVKFSEECARDKLASTKKPEPPKRLESESLCTCKNIPEIRYNVIKTYPSPNNEMLLFRNLYLCHLFLVSF